jgi:hypothetical protein
MYTTLPVLCMLPADAFGAALAFAADSTDANWAGVEGVGGGGGNFGVAATMYMLTRSIFHFSRWNTYMAL